MKSFALAVALSFFFIACADDDVIPLPPLPPVNMPDAEEAQADEPVSQGTPVPEQPKPEQPKPKPEQPKPKPEQPKPKPEPPPKPVAKQAAVSAFNNSGQLNSGRYTIQVAVLTSEASAKAIVKKLASNGIKAYTVKVSNPAKLTGSYHRVRIGYFNEKTAAENFANSNIGPLGYDWWIDRSANDHN